MKQSRTCPGGKSVLRRFQAGQIGLHCGSVFNLKRKSVGTHRKEAGMKIALGRFYWWARSWRRRRFGYGVLSHEELIDIAWDSDIRPALLRRFRRRLPIRLSKRTLMPKAAR